MACCRNDLREAPTSIGRSSSRRGVVEVGQHLPAVGRLLGKSDPGVDDTGPTAPRRRITPIDAPRQLRRQYP